MRPIKNYLILNFPVEDRNRGHKIMKYFKVLE